jgi:hypothetical protein
MLFHRSPFFHGMRLQSDRCDPCFAFAFVGFQQLCHFDSFFSKHWFTGNTIYWKYNFTENFKASALQKYLGSY